MLLLTDWKFYAVVFITAIVCSIGGYSIGSDLEAASWQEKESKAIQDRIKANKVKDAQNEQDKKRIQASIQQELLAARTTAANATRQLRINAKLCGTGGTQMSGEQRNDDRVTSTWLLPEDTSRDLTALMLKADEIVASCRGLQTRVKECGQD